VVCSRKWSYLKEKAKSNYERKEWETKLSHHYWCYWSVKRFHHTGGHHIMPLDNTY